MDPFYINKIKEEINKLKSSQAIQVLWACESGSRGWGFPSPDSDYDVRIIYAKNADNYLSIFPQKDTIEIPITSELDIGGWDFKKVLNLIYKSNPVVWEWLQSPIIYHEERNFGKILFSLATPYYNPVHAYHHYWSMAMKGFPFLEEESVKIKKVFYILRPLLSAKWIQCFENVPPMEFSKLLEADYISQRCRDDLMSLVQMKSTMDEKQSYHWQPLVKEYIENLKNDCINKSIPNEKKDGNPDVLNDFFLSWIKNVN